MRHVLVTGGAGFIGSHLYDALRQQGTRVRVLDNLSGGSRNNLPRDADLFVGDVTDPATLHMALTGIDGCFHLAAVASVQRSTREWLTSHRTNVTGLIAMFDAIRRQRRQIPVVYASSAAVYGNCAASPISEAAEKCPRSAYGADKYGCELHARIAAEIHDIPSIGLRFFNVYGPRQNPCLPNSGVISVFCQRILSGLDIEIYSDGRQVRDFVFVDDAVQALLNSMNCCKKASLPKASVYNVCTGKPTSILELVGAIARLVERSPKLRFLAGRPGDICIAVGCPDRARTDLGMSCQTSLHDGLTRVLRWMADQPRSSLSVRPDRSASSLLLRLRPPFPATDQMRWRPLRERTGLAYGEV